MSAPILLSELRQSTLQLSGLLGIASNTSRSVDSVTLAANLAGPWTVTVCVYDGDVALAEFIACCAALHPDYTVEFGVSARELSASTIEVAADIDLGDVSVRVVTLTSTRVAGASRTRERTAVSWESVAYAADVERGVLAVSACEVSGSSDVTGPVWLLPAIDRLEGVES